MATDARKGWGSLGRAVGIAALVLLCLALLVGAEALVRYVVPESPNVENALQLRSEAVQAWLALLAVGIGLFVVFGLWRALRLLYGWLLGGGSPLGPGASARLVGLVVAVLAFPRGVQWLLLTPLLALVDLLRSLPGQVLNLLQRSRGRNQLFSIEDALTRLLDLAQLVAAELARAATRLLDASALPDVVLALALWVLVSRAFSGVQGKTGLRAWMAGLDEARQRLLLLGGVFLAGVFLSVASIVAIPYLQEEKVPADLTRENLGKSLEFHKVKPEVLAELVTDALLKADPLGKPAAAGGAASSASAAPSTPPSMPAPAPAPGVAEALSPLEAVLARVREQREAAVVRAMALRNGLPARQAQVIESVLSAFETEMRQQMSAQERFTFYRELQGIARRELGEQMRAVNECKQGLESTDAALRFLADNLRLIRSQGSTDAAGAALSYTFDAANGASSAYARICVANPIVRTEFVAPEAGAGWGPFGWVANWLLRTRSFALTLITGMLGFGLLGAAISSFVRAEPVRAGDPRGLVGHVVIRGVSAAVVVFLAVKGGLAVFASNSSEPNAYILFFICLVGAVFSEDVWTWARARFKEKFLDAQPPHKDDGAAPRVRPGRQPTLRGKRARRTTP